MGELVLRESSDMGKTSSDDELSDYRKEDMLFAREMMHSKDGVDQRLISTYKMTKAFQKVKTRAVDILEAVKQDEIKAKKRLEWANKVDKAPFFAGNSDSEAMDDKNDSLSDSVKNRKLDVFEDDESN